MNKHSSVPAPFVALFALAVVGAAASPAFAASLTRSVDLDAGPDEVWSVIGSFCAIADWHPAVGSCTLDGRSPPTRTLVTRDGRSTFVELEVARNDEARLYSYAFIGRPFPVEHYTGTLHVAARPGGGSRVIWHGVYAPEPGKTQEAHDDFAGIYESGLAALKARFAH